MKILLLLFLLVAPFASAADPAGAARKPFPDDFTPTPCAPDVCKSYSQWEIPKYAELLRGVLIPQKWVDEQWEELQAAMKPFCVKIASCMTIPGNQPNACLNLLIDDILDTSARFERHSLDWMYWRFSVLTYYVGMGGTMQRNAKAAQACGRRHFGEAARPLDVWVEPATIPLGTEATFTVYAVDAESRIPVFGDVKIDAGTRFSGGQMKEQQEKTFQEIKWRPRLRRVENAYGRDIVTAPTIEVSAKGYATFTLPMPVRAGRMIATMKPKRLRRGTNRFVVETRDAETGALVEARVMAGDHIVGPSNQPLVLELARGEKRPEIWVTSLFDHYSDVIVLPGRR